MYIELFNLKMIDTQWALILPVASYPVGVYLVFQYYKAALPADLVASAKGDGCSDLQFFGYIGLPLVRNFIGVLAFTNFAIIWGNFFAANLFIDNTYLRMLPAGISVFISNCLAIIPGPIPCIHSPDHHYIGRAEVAVLGDI
jgi:ABC-type glycerol-3-phosphate transport system permease component